MNKVKFGPSGNSNLFYQLGYKSSVEAPAWLRSLGLSAYEYSFGRGYNMSQDKAIEIGKEACANGVEISVHAPYYINFANESEEMVEKSYNYVLTGLKMLRFFGGRRLIFHASSQGKLSREVALELTRKRLEILAKKVYENGYSDMILCPETMGKPLQIGTFKEIVDLCTVDKIFVPTFDFGHIYSLSLGKFGSYEDYVEVFSYALEKLGERARFCHIHFSQIEYGQKGEIRHLDFGNGKFGPSYEPMLKAISDLGLFPTIICESHSNMATDALEMKQFFEKI